jgi:hypothetical protein
MRHWMHVFSMFALGAAMLAVLAPAHAAEGTAVTQSVTMTFAEPIHPSLDCPGFPDVSCGSGQVKPLGQATDIVVFGAGCGGTCDLRTIYLAGGSLILEETVSDVVCPQVCRPGPLELASATLTDVVIGGTGMFEGATGTLTGTVRLAASNLRPAGTSTVKLSGTLRYAG